MSMIQSFFSDDYKTAQSMFIELSQHSNYKNFSYKHPLKGLNKEDLSTDITLVGNPDAKKTMLIVSGTHGVEGFCGSAAQSAYLDYIKNKGMLSQLGDDISILFVHALNPYGFSWLRRVNEDNVDLNRNFISHKHHPENPLFGEISDALCPRSWFGLSRIKADLRLLALKAKWGVEKLKDTITKGQYKFPKCLFYGGKKPVWSNITINKIINDFLIDKKHVSLIDLHTGLGPYGYGEPISSHDPKSKSFSLIQDWYQGEVKNLESNASVSSPVVGHLYNALENNFENDQLTAITLEFGTYDTEDVLHALRAENWAHFYGNQEDKDVKEIKLNLKKMFYPNEEKWNKDIIDRSFFIFEKTLDGLKKI